MGTVFFFLSVPFDRSENSTIRSGDWLRLTQKFEVCLNASWLRHLRYTMWKETRVVPRGVGSASQRDWEGQKEWRKPSITKPCGAGFTLRPAVLVCMTWMQILWHRTLLACSACVCPLLAWISERMNGTLLYPRQAYPAGVHQALRRHQHRPLRCRMWTWVEFWVSVEEPPKELNAP